MKPLTFEQFIAAALDRGIIDFSFRASRAWTNGHIHFYVHPAGKDGDTRDWVINGNSLTVDPCVVREDER